MRPLDRITQFRPRSYDDSHPMYCPDRDIAVVASGLLENVRIAFTAGRFSQWLPLFEKLIADQAVSAEEAVHETGKRMAAFLRAALARPVQPDGTPAPLTEQQAALPVDFKAAMEALVHPDPHGSFFVSAMMGYMLLDYIFYALRQSAAVGPTHQHMLDDFVALATRLADGFRTGQATQETAAENLKQAVQLLLATGFTGKQIEEMTSTLVAKCAISPS